MILFELIKDMALTVPHDAELSVDISDVCCDSRKTTPGCLFVCVPGAVADGHLYAPAAYEMGCRHFVAEHPLPDLPADAVVMLSEDTRVTLALLSARLFGNPSEELTVIGITGTKGKTSTALMIYELLNAHGYPCGYIGSNGVYYGSFHGATVNTTPESYTLQLFMREMLQVGVRYLVMEVSSQALYLHRVMGISFDICLFTNFSPDHIGGHEHPDLDHYKSCKKRLFREGGAHTVIYNADDPVGREMADAAPRKARRITYAINAPADHRATDQRRYRTSDKLGVTFTYQSEGEPLDITLSTPGAFSVFNALGAIAVCRALGLGMAQIAEGLSSVAPGGRFETVPALPYATFIIDYAHNRVSLTSALETLRAYEPHRLICLFGSVGGRTKGRRIEMGEVAARLADLCILTADNPDFEDPDNVIADIATQFRFYPTPFVKIPDRAAAIQYAVEIAQPGDIILLAGKGHEDYQLIRGRKVPFSERDILMEAAAHRLLAKK